MFCAASKFLTIFQRRRQIYAILGFGASVVIAQ
jgi:hypothetical protein